MEKIIEKYICIAPYPQPNKVFKNEIGDIFIRIGIHFINSTKINNISEKEIILYPHLFSPVED